MIWKSLAPQAFGPEPTASASSKMQKFLSYSCVELNPRAWDPNHALDTNPQRKLSTANQLAKIPKAQPQP